MREGTASKRISKFVYQWIKAKIHTPSPNLIKDSDGNIVSDPSSAMRLINEQWDDIYSANALHEDPFKILEIIWPKIESRRLPATLPVITGETLMKQVQRRRVDAAAGLDGWRTIEMQCLPVKMFDIAASYFRSVEEGVRGLPAILTSTRQILLDKCGEDHPLQKRIISIFPIFLIAYTSARYRQLQSWLIDTMPPSLYGGIKTRKLLTFKPWSSCTLTKLFLTRIPLLGLSWTSLNVSIGWCHQPQVHCFLR